MEGRQQFEQLAQQCIDLTVQHTRADAAQPPMQKKTPGVGPPGNRLRNRSLRRLSQGALGGRGDLAAAMAGVGDCEKLCGGMAARALEELLNDANWRVEADQARPGEKCYAARPNDGRTRLFGHRDLAPQLLHRRPRRRTRSAGPGAGDCGGMHARLGAADVPGRGGGTLRGGGRRASTSTAA